MAAISTRKSRTARQKMKYARCYIKRKISICKPIIKKVVSFDDNLLHVRVSILVIFFIEKSNVKKTYKFFFRVY